MANASSVNSDTDGRFQCGMIATVGGIANSGLRRSYG